MTHKSNFRIIYENSERIFTPAATGNRTKRLGHGAIIFEKPLISLENPDS